MNVVILGDGLLARSIFDVIAPREREFGEPPALVMLSHTDFEITSMDSLVKALQPHKPDVLINTVALHHLARCEDDPMLAQLVNAIGAGRVASLVPTIYISTDYVFNDGGPHDEVIPGQRPRSVYGQTKLAGELATLEQGGIVVRVSALFGHHRSHKGLTFPELVTSGFDPMKLPTDQRFSPTYAPDAAERIAELALALGRDERRDLLNGVLPPPSAMSKVELERRLNPQGVYHAANSGTTTWYEFATAISEITRHKRTITGAVANDQLRPKHSGIRSTRLPPLRHWLDALRDWSIERERVLDANRVSPLRADVS